MADRPFVDTHVHLLDRSVPGLHYDWLEPQPADDPILGAIGAVQAPRYWAEDFLAETRFHSVHKFVHVQAAVGTEDPVLETQWVQAFSDRLGIPQGLVAGVDLSRKDIAAQLDRHAGYPGLRGVRDLRYDAYDVRSAAERGLSALERHGGLVLCHAPAVDAMPCMRDAILRHPGLTVCIDHAGVPERRSKSYFARWRSGIRALAEAENAVVKISGLGMADHRWTTESLRPWVLACIEAFRPDRAFFGTNWPIDRLFSSYGDVVDAYAQLISEFSETEQDALFSGNAERVFRI
jgi:predicted TIM-barrel fold metal-dependent hydrolase